MSEIFISDFSRELIRACYQFRPVMFDMTSCLPLKKKVITKIKDSVLLWMLEQNIVKRRFDLGHAENIMQNLLAHCDELTKVYGLFSDEHSRKTFIQVLLFRILGAGHVTLPLFWRSYTQLYKKIPDSIIHQGVDKQGIWTFNEYSINGKQGQFSLIVPEVCILTIFQLEQYAYRKGTVHIEIAPGDIVIDGGACWGDVAIYAADNTGPSGHVYSFEFVEENLRHLRRNLDLNPALKDRVTILERALHSKSGERLNFLSNGPGSNIQGQTGDHSGQSVESCALDDLVRNEDLKSIQFIKLDIEGSELACLEGAEESIQRFKPKLAIAAYHKFEDLWDLPLFIHTINPDYHLYFDHFAPNQWESMLYAKCE